MKLGLLPQSQNLHTDCEIKAG